MDDDLSASEERVDRKQAVGVVLDEISSLVTGYEKCTYIIFH